MKTSKSNVSKMTLAMAIIQSVYADQAIAQPRKVSIDRLQTELGMEKTTASTYHGLGIQKFREAEQAAAEQRLSEGKPVWSAIKLNSDNIATSIGLFTSATAAKQFNRDFRHDGVVKGNQPLNVAPISKPVGAFKKPKSKAA